MADIRASLSRMSPQERDIVIRTLLAEASNQGPRGLQAVAAVIGNRSAQSGMSPGDVVQARNQFEPWNTRAGRAKMAGYSPDGSDYRTAGAALDAAMQNDPTGGATHFYAPKAQAALGRGTPSWARGQGTDIGDHRFYNLGYQPGGNRHGIPPRPPGEVPQVQMDPAVRASLPMAPEEPRTVLPPAPNTLKGSRYDDGTQEGTLSDPIKKIAKALGLSNADTESFRLGLALGGSDPVEGWGGGLQGGFSSGGFGAEGVG